MIDGMLAGLMLVLSWPAFGYLLAGVFIGMWIGAVPGLGGVVGLVLLLPFTFGMEPVHAFALLMGLYAVTSTSDTIPAIMLGIPGSVASQATILDGYPLAKKGEAARAFGAAYTVSAFGGVFGALLMAVSIPFILPVIFAFGLPEFLMLGLLGLTMVGVLSGDSIAKGLVVATFGLLLTTVGYADATGVPRFSLGTDYLLDGIPIVPIALGLFGIPELLEMAVKDTPISRVKMTEGNERGMLRGVKDVFRHRWLALRSALVGAYVGILPGLGGSIVDWIAYGHAVQSSPDKSGFGKGDIRGVIAPEAANNSSRAGALIPTLAFGIPGSLGAAILLSALVMKGLQPGPDMMTVNLDLTFSMIWDLAIANILAAGALMLLSRQVGKIAFLPAHSVVPGVMVVLLMGAWVATSSMGDWWTCVGMGVLGYAMKQGNWPRPPLILALVLGSMIENNYQLTMQVYDGVSWMYQRPIVVAIEVVMAITIFLAARGITQTKMVGNRKAGQVAQAETLMSTGLAIVLLAVFVWAYFMARSFSDPDTAQFPLIILMAAIPLGAYIVIRGVRDCLRQLQTAASPGQVWADASKHWDLPASARFFSYLVLVIAMTYVVGQLIALPLFVAAYARRWGKFGWLASISYAAFSLLIVWGVYASVMKVHLYPSLLFG
ncbi:MAG: tripartite tricarboxylate transporter permease [Woeseiaceae bacterium]|nr:tripartite tricarboxylate transporter permease [Woeseiaceae bacterium]